MIHMSNTNKGILFKIKNKHQFTTRFGDHNYYDNRIIKWYVNNSAIKLDSIAKKSVYLYKNSKDCINLRIPLDENSTDFLKEFINAC